MSKQFHKNRKDDLKFKKKSKQEENDEIQRLQSLYNSVEPSQLETFNDFPISKRTLKGLEACGYTVPTEIQKESIYLALRGCDVLGAAKTGSGKTLAFLIPVLEVLFIQKWTKLDGLGALIITPTRELALQIYETLCKVGRAHTFSAGLIIGGKDLTFEKGRMNQVNIIICTPGRLLQHMDENPLFDASNVKVLVLDEADRCLDMGFEQTMNCIIENIPKKRLTLLFSATQTKSVRDLARLSLKDPKYISVHEHEKHKTPEGLTQSYLVCDQHDKLAMLWSFLKTHGKQKILVFLATCNQVKYLYDLFCKLRIPVPIFQLQGKMHQLKRMDVYHSFCRKQHGVLLCTDIASRGLDFPEVNWVIQLDCPENPETYIHRAGRTARYHKGGECLLVLNSSETAMVEKLESNRIPINEIKVNPAKLISPQAKVEALLAKFPDLKSCAQRAFVAYAKSVFLMGDKSVFDIKQIDTDKYARSLGLVISPRIRFLERVEKAKKAALEKKAIQKEDDSKEEQDEGEESGSGEDNSDKEEASEEEEKEVQHVKKLTILKKDDLPTFNFHMEEDGSDDDILQMKRKNHELEIDTKYLPDIEEVKNKKKALNVLTKAALAKRILKKKIIPNKKIKFTEEGEVMMEKMKEKVTEAGKKYDAEGYECGLDIAAAKQVLREEDRWDRKLFREKVKAKRREAKRKLKEEKRKANKGSDEVDIEEGVEEIEGAEDSDDSGPDLSWLPDPDKIYGKQRGSESSSDQEKEDGGSTSEIKGPLTSKRKAEVLEEEPSEDEMEAPLDQEEAIALRLLSS